MTSTRTNARCCPWEGSTPRAVQAGKQLYGNVFGGLVGSWTWPSHVPWQQGRPAASWDVLAGTEPVDQGKGLCLIFQHLLDTHLTSTWSFIPQHKKNAEKVEQVQQRASKLFGDWGTCQLRRCWRNWPFSSWRTDSLWAAPQHWWGY